MIKKIKNEEERISVVGAKKGKEKVLYKLCLTQDGVDAKRRFSVGWGQSLERTG